jgi:CheY-like chemotaxis protein
MPKPLYGYPVTRVINEGYDAQNLDSEDNIAHPDLTGLKVLVVDDEPMNLIVAEGIFRNFGMSTDLAGSGQEAIAKFRKNNYDVVFMDHMMPEMDGVEAMKLIKTAAKERDKKAIVIALTANAVSGAREMFMREGFDGFIAKPMSIPEFEHVMLKVLAQNGKGRGGQAS